VHWVRCSWRGPRLPGAAFARAPGGLLLKRLCFALCVGLTSTFMGFAVAMAAPAAQSNICPVAADDVVTDAIGEPVTIDPLFVTVNGTDTECIFDTADHLVLVRRQTNFFDDAASGATPEQLDQLRTLIFDQVDYTPVEGVGDAAFLATVSDRSLASQRQAVLIIKRGSDVFAFGVMDTPDALTTATALAQAVLYAQPS
jgi:hypothetical protein